MKPLALLKLEKGNLYGEQKEREKYEPQPKVELMPECPSRFSKKEKQAWQEIAGVLKNYGLFTIANAIQLELLSTAWAQYISESLIFAKNPKIIVNGPDGGKMYNEHFNAQHRLGKLVDKYSQNLGLSSIALAKIGTLIAKKKKEKKDEFFEN